MIVMDKILSGAIAGLGATVPMTIVMETIFRRLPWQQRYPLPPRKVTMELADTLGFKQELNEPQRHALTLGSHLGYGAAMGALYSLTAQRRLPGALGGAVFGLGVWAGNYLAMLPAAGLHPHAAHSPPERNLLMIASHLVWGAVLGASLDRQATAGGSDSTA
jgi:uncharacterized membrane protein YagU involved in acid resistance